MRGKKDNKIMGKKASVLLFFVVLTLWMIPGCSTVPARPEETGRKAIGTDDHENRILGEMGDTDVVRPGEAVIEGVGTFTFRPEVCFANFAKDATIFADDPRCIGRFCK